MDDERPDIECIRKLYPMSMVQELADYAESIEKRHFDFVVESVEFCANMSEVIEERLRLEKEMEEAGRLMRETLRLLQFITPRPTPRRYLIQEIHDWMERQEKAHDGPESPPMHVSMTVKCDDLATGKMEEILRALEEMNKDAGS